MKTTIELPDATFRQAKVLASSRGMTLKQLFTEALEDRLRRDAAARARAGREAPWMAGFGALADLSAENLRLAGVIEEEFERLAPDDIA